MAKQPKTKQISTREGVLTGLMLLGQISGILAGFAVGGYLLDLVLGSAPLGLAGGVVIGSLWATFTVLRTVKRDIEEMTGEDELPPQDEEEKD